MAKKKAAPKKALRPAKKVAAKTSKAVVAAPKPSPFAKRVALKPVNAATVRAKHKEFLFPCVTNYYEEPIVLTKGEGSWAWDSDGREYLDLFGGILTLGVGHCHPEVVSRIEQQIENIGHTSSLY